MNPFNIGFPSLILILVLFLILFGPNKLPELGRSIGLTMKEFKKSTSDLLSENENENGPQTKATEHEDRKKG
ncbi:twin-arginine translocase TatA/TatE family subunit [Alkalihalobacillus sp. TS-13]|uniref:twin-arginine translocase TatA/TatE family subunit n=1 Tax=Alkalihalobacillus sp. TS-13 TaxID=2842455 RepID=UPI001C88AE5F|nr:twin-arginine translocase TatA/TatE family subunit [Alkalihalobacillus sp. TS-13]